MILAKYTRRNGYRRVHVMLRWERWFVNEDAMLGLYNGWGLKLQSKPSKLKVRAKNKLDRKTLSAPRSPEAITPTSPSPAQKSPKWFEVGS